MRFFKKVPLIRSREKSEFKRFAMIGLGVFVLLNGINVYGEAKGFYRQARPLAIQGAAELQKGTHALKNQDFLQAKIQFKSAETSLKNLEEASRMLTAQAYDFLGQGLASGVVEQLIEIGLATSELGQSFATTLEAWKKEPQKVPLDFFRVSQKSLNQLWQQTESLNKKVKVVSFLPLPQALKAKVKKAEQELSDFIQILAQGRITVNAALKLLGEKSPHHYLVLLQNRNERRATGGFIGSFILVTVNDGKITKLEPKDVYESDGQLTVKIPPPPGIDQVAETWGLRDANYSPDFPTSAKKILWFLERSRGPSVDTVIAVDQTVAEKLLELTGPIELPGFPFTLKAKNLDTLLSFHTEAKLSKAKTPKGLLFDLILALKEELGKLNDFEALQSAVTSLIEGGHLQLYSQDSDIQTLAEAWKMDGRFLAPVPKTDFLAVVSTSIGGNKSDRFIKMDLHHQAKIEGNGSVVDRLTIQKIHTWQPSDFLRWQRYLDYYRSSDLDEKTLRFILGEGPNVDYLRVYVPEGSRLIHQPEVGGPVTVSEDLDYTVFAVPMTVKAGETKAMTLEYELPFKLLQNEAEDYRLITRAQIGAERIISRK